MLPAVLVEWDVLFDELPMTADELAQLGATRGEYRIGDQRGFVRAHEQACLSYNCWMRRNADGSVRYVSEP